MAGAVMLIQETNTAPDFECGNFAENGDRAPATLQNLQSD